MDFFGHIRRLAVCTFLCWILLGVFFFLVVTLIDDRTLFFLTCLLLVDDRK